MGLVHLPSGTCAIDIDDEAWTRHIFDELGLDMDAMLDYGPRILSKLGRAKVLFRAPADLKLTKIQMAYSERNTSNGPVTMSASRSSFVTVAHADYRCLCGVFHQVQVN
jgi:hypothetical protein